MKKKLLIFATLVFLLSLAACSATQAADPTTDSTVNTTADPQQIPESTRLLIGTFLLEDTDQAVTSDQAAELILLWKGVKALSAADNTTQAELDAIYTQIKEAMSPDQLAAIDSMTIDMTAMGDLMQQYGVGWGENSQGDLPGSEFGFMPDEFPEGMPDFGDFEPPSGGGGGMPPGGLEMPGGMGGEFSRGANLTEDQRATLQAQQSQTGPRLSSGMNLMLVEPLIRLLEQRAAQ